MPKGYTINVGSTYFSCEGRSAYLRFTSRHRINLTINSGILLAYIQNGPVEIIKKFKHPSLPMRDTLEDAQAVLTYLLKLKDQMIELGYYT